MKTRTNKRKTSFSRLRAVMMLFMLLGMVGANMSPVTAAPVDQGNGTFAAAQTTVDAEVCAAFVDAGLIDADGALLDTYANAGAFVTAATAIDPALAANAAAVFGGGCVPPADNGDNGEIPPVLVWVCNLQTGALLQVNENALAADPALREATQTEIADEQCYIDNGDNGDDDKVWVCNIAANTPVLLHVSANAANDNTLGFPFRYATDDEVDAGRCFGEDDEDETGTLIVKKYFCKDKDLKHPTVGKKGDYDHCKPAKPNSVDFYVLAFGETKVDLDETTLLSTGVTLPVGTHELFEVFKGKAYSLGEFEITAGETTTITVFNPAKYDKPDHEKPGTDKPGTDKPGADTPGADKPGADTPGTSDGTTASTGGTTAVTTLPSTGSGAEASNDAVASRTLLAGAAALAGTGMLLRKERPAA
jgi:hypothetical protein